MTIPPLLRFTAARDRVFFAPIEVIVEQSINKIDLAEVTTRRLAPGSSELVDDRLISFEWGPQRPAAPLQTFYGYLEGTTERSTGKGRQKTNDVMLRVLGAASVMRNKNTRVWHGITIPHVLAQVCDTHRMNLVSDESTTRWTHIKQNNESDWHFINRLAKRLGWWAHIDGTTVLVLNPDKILSRIPPVPQLQVSQHFVQSTEDIPGLGAHNTAQRHATWKSDNGAVFSFHSDDRVPVTGETLSWSKIMEEVEIDEAYTYEEAKESFEGIDREASWYIRRKLRVDGRADIRPLQPVTIQSPQVTQDNRTVPYLGWKQYDGVWITESVKHRLVFGKDPYFTTEVVSVVMLGAWTSTFGNDTAVR